MRIAPLNGVAEKIELTAVRRKDEQHRWRRDCFLDLHTLAFALTDKSYSLESAIEAFGSKVKEAKARSNRKDIGHGDQLRAAGCSRDARFTQRTKARIRIAPDPFTSVPRVQSRFDWKSVSSRDGN